jgi:hypothetical protein
MFHVVPNHSFAVQIETCKKCHEDEIHRAEQPGEEVPAAININPGPTQYMAPTNEAPETEKTNGGTTNLILVAVLMCIIGLLAGIIFSSRLKKLFT